MNDLRRVVVEQHIVEVLEMFNDRPLVLVFSELTGVDSFVVLLKRAMVEGNIADVGKGAAVLARYSCLTDRVWES